MNARFFLCLIFLFLLSACADEKQRITVAVASNFKPTLETIVERYQQQHAFEVSVVSASSGLLLAQILQGAPYDLFLSADQAKVDALLAEGVGTGQHTVYAQGRLALWVNEANVNPPCWSFLKQASVKHVVIANPGTAPYGEVAEDLLREIPEQNFKTVFAANVAQAFALLYQRQAQAGFVAYAQIQAAEIDTGCIELMPTDDRLRQSMLLINPKAQSFYAFLMSDEIQQLIKESGYDAQNHSDEP